MNFIETLQKHYNGFYITEPAGNNAFSFDKRKQREIYVPPIIQGDLNDLAVSDKIVFSEINDEGREISKEGLKNFIYWPHQGKDIFIFDNHNHAFFFWMCALKFNKLHFPQILLHVDQHKDMREPDHYLECSNVQDLDFSRIFEYTNYGLNVGNFIKPAQALGIFADVIIIDSQEGFNRQAPEGFIFDLDMDIFSPEMSYIEENFKVKRIREYIQRATFITVATSPYFMDQARAIDILKTLF